MQFIEQYQQLKEIFNLESDEISIPGSRVMIKNADFLSQPEFVFSSADLMDDIQIKENYHFRYPVIIPKHKDKNNEVIIFMHGLNERTWNKHLIEAKYLAERTGKSVILFPLSYHINRGLPEWIDIRKMSVLLAERKQKYPDVKEASIINLALSERLTLHPERFFLSGLQSAFDLEYLLKEIREGKHPLFTVNTKVDIFAYSISCMLLQSMMISRPDHFLGKTRIVFFAGGSIFSHIQGMSKFIMDSVAFESIRSFYHNIIRNKNLTLQDFRPWLMEHSFGKAFSSLIIPEYLKEERQKRMSEFNNSLMVIALRNDKIIPIEGIKQAIGNRFFQSNQMKIVHFPYDYIHENPFPVLYRKIEDQVTQAFRSVFETVVRFYMDKK